MFYNWKEKREIFFYPNNDLLILFYSISKNILKEQKQGYANKLFTNKLNIYQNPSHFKDMAECLFSI